MIPFAVKGEKDWWVGQSYAANQFSDAHSQTLVFKGETSFSKAWKLINGFSEEIDLALDKEFFEEKDIFP